MSYLIRFVQPDGTVVDVEGVEGQTLMHAAIAAGVDGIIGECGGSCACGTCHVYLDESRLAGLLPPGEAEAEILEGVASERTPCSRLSCQVVLTGAMQEMTVRVAPEQF